MAVQSCAPSSQRLHQPRFRSLDSAALVQSDSPFLTFSCLHPSEMTVVCAAAAVRFLFLFTTMALCSLPLLGASATLNSVLINSNAIKNLPPPLGGAGGQPGSAVSVAPGVLYEGGNKYQTLDNYQVRGVSGIRRFCDPDDGGLREEGVGCPRCVRFGVCLESLP